MSDKVDQFLSECGGNNFTATAPRPPVPGEENEKESNGGMSTRSSGSHKSHQSHTSGRSSSSNKGDINPATPRKSNLSCSVPGYNHEMDAPLGFEPEGSAANSPPFTENSTPPYIKWAESLNVLLDDRDGVQLFRTFLDQEEIGAFSLEFWFACQGLKKGLKEKTSAQTTQIIKVIHKKYIKSDKLPFLRPEIKRAISENIQSDIDLSIFNAAQREVEEYMANEPYQLFLKSDLYVQYVSRGGESPKSSNSSSGSNSARPLSSGPLPTLKEDQELQQDDFAVPFSVIGPPKSRTPHSDLKRQEYISPYSYPARPVPYHVSYAPVSAQDSEIQSLSSQDDALSLTDSSVDGHSHSTSRKHNKRIRAMQRKAVSNKDMAHIIPRTERAPKDRNIAEVDPKAFAEKLISELEKVVREREKEERVQLSLSKVMNQSDISENWDKSYISATSSRTNTTTTSIVPLLTSSMIEEENADSILEEHCSRIWDSAHHTPSRSPGRHSPRSKSPNRFRKPFAQTQPPGGSSSMPSTLHNKSYNKKRNEFYSMSSFDSGVGEDLNKCVETHKHVHHHYHHHHERDRRRSKRVEIQAQHHSTVCWADSSARLQSGATGARQKTNSSRTHSSDARSASDANSYLDSGISMVESVGQTHIKAEPTDPSTTKVIQWMLDNDNINISTGGGPANTDSISSKRSHKASALAQVPQQQQYNKHSSSKKVAAGHINRSASADSSSRVPWVSQGGGVMPSQPIATDPSMPIMPPPNTTVQLEEVNRRLEADHSIKSTPVKSKSFTGVPSKDKRPVVPASQSCFQVRTPVVPAGKMPGLDLDTSTESKADKRSSKKSSGSGNTSTSSKPEETVIGYYFCGEPIPYRITVPQPCVTLGQLKQLIGKRGFFKYFLKTYSRDFDTEAVYEEFKEDSKVLPVFEGKVVVKIDRIDEMEKLSAKK